MTPVSLPFTGVSHFADIVNMNQLSLHITLVINASIPIHAILKFSPLLPQEKASFDVIF